MSLLDRDHYRKNVLDEIADLRRRLDALERTELSGVVGPPGPAGPTGPAGTPGTPGPGAPSPLTRGDLLVVDSTPEITTLPIGAAGQHLRSDGTDPGWSNTIDLNGVADAGILDADGDTTISADTDDQINFEVGGVDVLILTPTALTGISTLDLYPMANEAGVQYRLDGMVSSWSEHWNVSALPAGWSWAADGAGDFTHGAAPDISYANPSVFQFGDVAGSDAYYVYRAVVASYTSKFFQVRILPYAAGQNVAGVRLDYSTDPEDHYIEVYWDYVVGEGLRITGTYNDGAGATSIVLATCQPIMMWQTIALSTGGSTGNWSVNISIGTDFKTGYVSTLGTGKTWTPDRVGMFVRPATTNRHAVVDACAGTLCSF